MAGALEEELTKHPAHLPQMPSSQGEWFWIPASHLSLLGPHCNPPMFWATTGECCGVGPVVALPCNEPSDSHGLVSWKSWPQEATP